MVTENDSESGLESPQQLWLVMDLGETPRLPVHGTMALDKPIVGWLTIIVGQLMTGPDIAEQDHNSYLIGA